jgi:hypothetical protein
LPVPDRRHRAWLSFVKRVLEITSLYSVDDLSEFLNVAKNDYPRLRPLVQAYFEIADSSRTDVLMPGTKTIAQSARSISQMHLFDLLREKAFFPLNADLAHFASRVLPGIQTHRFDKMSRSDIAARIIEYLENLPQVDIRKKLEASMREALSEIKGRPTISLNRKSFLSKWEKIIKRVEE